MRRPFPVLIDGRVVSSDGPEYAAYLKAHAAAAPRIEPGSETWNRLRTILQPVVDAQNREREKGAVA